MFESLDETMKKDNESANSLQQRILLYAGILILSVLVFAGLVFSVRMLE
ncbi:MAG: hypothetical protein IT160_11025 [Bryobacterales bacterium]|nr:hypothetical protein [Bryobacterales bacterium]